MSFLRAARVALSLGACSVTTAARAAGQAVPQAAPAAEAADSVRIPDGTLFFRTAGRGLTVMLLNGGPGYSGDVLRTVYEHVARSARAVLPDQRGTGRSTLRQPDSTTLTVARAVEDIETLRTRLGADRLVLLGHSWGGALALAYAAAHSERVCGLILVGSATPDVAATAPRVSEKLAGRLTQRDRDSVLALVPILDDPAQHDRAQRAIQLLQWKAYMFNPANAVLLGRQLGPRTYDRAVSQVMYRDWSRRSAELFAPLAGVGRNTRPPIPVSIIYGAADPVGQVSAPGLRATFPGSTTTVVERSGHHPWVEAPQAFYGALDASLSRIRATRCGQRVEATPHRGASGALRPRRVAPFRMMPPSPRVRTNAPESWRVATPMPRRGHARTTAAGLALPHHRDRDPVRVEGHRVQHGAARDVDDEES